MTSVADGRDLDGHKTTERLAIMGEETTYSSIDVVATSAQRRLPTESRVNDQAAVTDTTTPDVR